MKKIFLLLIAVSLLFISGCCSSDNKKATPPPSSTTAKTDQSSSTDASNKNPLIGTVDPENGKTIVDQYQTERGTTVTTFSDGTKRYQSKRSRLEDGIKGKSKMGQFK